MGYAVSLFDFIRHFKIIWAKEQELSKKCGSPLFCKGKFHFHPTRKIFSSSTSNFTLAGKFKFSPCNGKLQLVDGTGSIDVVIVGLPSNWNINCFYEVNEYYVILEGMAENETYVESLGKEYSSQSIALYAYFNWRSVCKRVFSHSSEESENDLEDLSDGTFHFIYVTHKYPIVDKGAISSSSGIFVEATILPWNLVVVSKDMTESTVIPKDKLNEAMENCHPNNSKDTCSYKRCKLGTSFSIPYMQEEAPGVHCLVATRNGYNDNFLIRPGVLWRINSKREYDGDMEKILLEFDPESLYTYHMLFIGCYYITKHAGNRLFSQSRSHRYSKFCNVHVTSENPMWSVSFLDQVYDIKSVFEHCDSKESTSCLDVILKFHTHDNDFLAEVAKSKECMLKQYVVPKDMPSLELSEEEVTASQMLHFGKTGSNSLPEGDLVSFKGDVIAVHSYSSGEDSKNKVSGVMNSLVANKEHNVNICVHVIVGDDIVKIYAPCAGSIFPVGFGAGVTVEFHRVIELSTQKKGLLLAHMSYVEMISLGIDHVNSYTALTDPSYYSYSGSGGPLNDYSSALISDLADNLFDTPVRLRCRVVSVLILILEHRRKDQGLQMSCVSSIDIPFCGLIMDDGSACCCCWVRARDALKFLGIQQCVLSKNLGSKSAKKCCSCYMENNNLEKMVEKHSRIVVRNCGSIFDSIYQDLVISASSEHPLSCSDEDVLKFAVYNSCNGPMWNLDVSVVKREYVSQLERQLEISNVPNHGLQNVWVQHVEPVNALFSLRSGVQKLSNFIHQM